jgi:hypothetical protein
MSIARSSTASTSIDSARGERIRYRRDTTATETDSVSARGVLSLIVSFESTDNDGPRDPYREARRRGLGGGA